MTKEQDKLLKLLAKRILLTGLCDLYLQLLTSDAEDQYKKFGCIMYDNKYTPACIAVSTDLATIDAELAALIDFDLNKYETLRTTD